ncbi:MAG: hypothetical protein ACREUU_20820, partial [Gammaproteobacteria bacterium]
RLKSGLAACGCSMLNYPPGSAMSAEPEEKVWVVIRVPKGSEAPEEASIHTGFVTPGPAYLLRDILNDKNQEPRYEFRVLEMPRFKVKKFRQLSA